MNKIILIILIIVLVFISIYLFNTISSIINIKKEKFEEYNKYPIVKTSKIPNVIYTYWHENNLPTFVKKCINSWKRHNPSYDIIIINKDNISKYIPFDIFKLKYPKTHQKVANFIRIYILSHYGGIWIDSTIYLNKSLDWIHSYQVYENSEFVGFFINSTHENKMILNTPIIENWFMASIPNSEFMKDWNDFYFTINNYNNEDEYLNFVRKTTDLSGIDAPGYLTMHVACQYILQNSNKKYKLSLLDAVKGPFLYLCNKKWPSFDHLLSVIIYFRGTESPIVKYRGPERQFIETLRLHYLYK